MNDPATYPHIPRACRRGDCNHELHPRYRSARCLSGECNCASKGLACGVTGIDRQEPAKEQPAAWKCVDCGYEDTERSLVCPNCAMDGALAAEEAEVQPTPAIATAPWRVHLIYTHGTENMPVSFRTTVQAADHNTALTAASKALERHTKGINLTNCHIRSYASCERVPDREKA